MRNRHIGKWRATIAAASVVVLGASSIAAADGEQVVVNNEDLFLYINGSSGADRVAVNFDTAAAEFLIMANFEIVPLENCHSVSATEARCSRFSSSNSLRADLGQGDDRIKLTAAAQPGTITGGAGNDRLISGTGRNKLAGDDGNDVLEAGGGNDLVIGGPGADKMYGGGGNDRLNADDGERDPVINCGSGDDTAWIDRHDPKPLHCETVRRARA